MTDKPEGGGARLMVGFEGQTVGDDVVRLIEEIGARSVILFARNIASAAQARDLIGELRSRVSWPLLVAVDQEGGAVVRVTRGATVFPGAMAIAAADDADLAETAGFESGRQLRGIGFDMNLAPVVDLQTNPANPGIGIRSFGADIDRAERMIRAWIRGHSASQIGSCLKHFPGKGAASVDAHVDLPRLEQTLEEFYSPHIEIFERVLRDCPDVAVMTTHLVLSAFDADRPATFSQKLIREILRGRLGFAGLLISDDLEMGAITKYGDVGHAAFLAAQAGHDLIPICHSAERQRAAAKRIDLALSRGEIDPAAHRQSLARIDAGAARNERSQLVDSTEGDLVARRIAVHAIHTFGDRHGLLPIRRLHRIVLFAAKPHSVVGVEEEMAKDMRALWSRLLEERALPARIIEFDGTMSSEAAKGLLALASSADRIIMTTWNARGSDNARQVLELAIDAYRDRLVVCHLRNPFDQALCPDDVTSLTSFGYRIVQLEALLDVLTGRFPSSGCLPAPIA